MSPKQKSWCSSRCAMCIFLWNCHDSSYHKLGPGWQKENFLLISTILWLTDKSFRKNGLSFQPPKKVVQQFFWGAQDLIWVQLILIMQKITKKSLFGHFLGYPPKCTTVHYSAVQCIEVQTLELFTPDGSNMTHNDPGWLCMARDDIPGVRGASGGTMGD